MATRRKVISEKQRQMLKFIYEFIRDNGYSPSLREIGTVVSMSSTSVVNYNLDHLQEKEYITRNPDTARSIRLLKRTFVELGVGLAETLDNVLRVPVWGVIKAGMPIPVSDTDTPMDYIALAKDLVPRGDDLFALRVNGDSMIDALVNDGDVVVMNRVSEVRDGDMVAAWLKTEEETTLKYFYREGNRARLQPANPHMDPIYTALDNVEIQGKVMMVVRTVEA